MCWRRIDDKGRSHAPSSAAADAFQAPEGATSTAEKLLRAVQKKLRQCEALQVRSTCFVSLFQVSTLPYHSHLQETAAAKPL